MQIIKTFALSKLVLPASTQCVPDYIIKRIERILFKFLWQSNEKVKRTVLIQGLDRGGLNMIDVRVFCNSLSASWITRILEANPNQDSWVQLPRYFLGTVDIQGLYFRFNFDERVFFPDIQRIPLFYKQAFVNYNKAFVSDKNYFENTIMNQPLWGNRYITHMTRCKKNVLFLRNWIRSGVRKIGDLVFRNGILNEQFVYEKVACKQNILCEIMLVKKALYPYQQSLREPQQNNLRAIKRYRSREFYDIFKLQMVSNDNKMRISTFLAPYCSADEEMKAFFTKVVQEKEKKLKEFNFKLLHGILPCNKNLMKWKVRLNSVCDVCDETQTIVHLLYDCYYVKPLWKVIDNVCKTKVTFKQILGLDELFDHSAVTTIICFLIYKEWLLLSLKNRKKKVSNSVRLL